MAGKGNKGFCEFGYPDEQFETVVSDNLHCAICSCVLKDPVMCKNEHCFCRGCITKHLQNYHTCPSCNQDLTVESLADVPRILRNLLSEKRIRCDHHERGCEEIVQLGNLASHVAVCGKAPVVCANEECSSEINREDQFRHQGEECRFRKVKCQNCEEMGSVVRDFGTSLGGLLDKMKTGLIAMENRFDGMESARSDQATPADPSSRVKDAKRPNEYAYVVAGGCDHRNNLLNTVEVFDKTANSWIQMQSMKKRCADASSVVYNGQVLVTGGISDDNHVVSSMTQFSRNACPFVPPSWSNLSVNLPRPLRGHCTVLLNDRLIVLGGYDADDSDMIYEIQLHFPFTTKVLAKLPSSTPIAGCGAVLANDKILMFGGRTRENANQATANVTMYDITKNEFKELAPLPYVLCNMATVKCEENVILAGAGGEQHPYNNIKNTVVSYNIETEESTELPPMKHCRSECCAVVDGSSLVVMGGRGQNGVALNSVEAFDFKTSTWSDLPSMNEIRMRFVAEIV